MYEGCMGSTKAALRLYLRQCLSSQIHLHYYGSIKAVLRLDWGSIEALKKALWLYEDSMKTVLRLHQDSIKALLSQCLPSRIPLNLNVHNFFFRVRMCTYCIIYIRMRTHARAHTHTHMHTRAQTRARAHTHITKQRAWRGILMLSSSAVISGYLPAARLN